MADANPAQFTILRSGRATPRADQVQRPTQEMLDSVEDGTIVGTPGGLQWIAMPAVPRRWEKCKRQIATEAVKQPETVAETPAPAVSQAAETQTSRRSR